MEDDVKKITRREFLSFAGGVAISTVFWNFFNMKKFFSLEGQQAAVGSSYGNSAYGGTPR